MKKRGFGRKRSDIEWILLMFTVAELGIGSAFGVAGNLPGTIVFVGSAIVTFIVAFIYGHST